MFGRSSKKFNTILFVFIFMFFKGFAQDKEIVFIVVDSLQNPISDVFIKVENQALFTNLISDDNGQVVLKDVEGEYFITTSHLGYVPIERKVFWSIDKNPKLVLTPLMANLQDIIVTAKEGEGLSTKSVINRKAMEHLQPSSFADLMELLPGGKAKTPNLTSTNRILIREFGESSGQYNTSSLGVQFLIDGAIMNTNSDLQTSSNIGTVNHSTTSIGVDMRTLSTNDIESVEIIRGIPSAAYGDLTSGLVKINRRVGYKALEARVKSDGFSKLFYVGRGFTLSPTWDFNVNFDYLNAKRDPRILTERYNRYGVSVRSRKIFNYGINDLTWYSNLDYNVSIDSDKVDPDLGYDKIDKYKNSKHVIYYSNRLKYEFHNDGIFKYVEFKANIRQGIEDLKQTKLVQFNGPRAISIAKETGVNDGYYPPTTFISDFSTEGRPLDLNTSLQTSLQFNKYKLKHKLELGIDYRYSKNYGKGQIYDIFLPPSPSMSTRPRSFNDIPAHQNLAFFIGDYARFQLNKSDFLFYTGIRVSTMLGINEQYSIANRFFTEPRMNLQWSLPKLQIFGKELKTDVTLGYGELYKLPTLGMLYPNKTYLDFTQLNFAHINPNVRRVNYMTYVIDMTNSGLQAAKNIKKEIKIDLIYQNHKIFITYFDEKMKSGFRQTSNYNTYSYKKYNTSHLDIHNLTQQPKLEDLPFEDKEVMISSVLNNNGSETYKRGIEFGYYSPRFKALQTKFTLTGAWFKTIYKNSLPIQEMPNVSLAGQGYNYVGIYANDTGYRKSGMNYNLMIDTYLPDLDMTISASVQGTWFLNSDRAYKYEAPISYFGNDGIIHPFLESDRTDTYKQWLIRPVSKTDNMAYKYPFDVQINFKVTKKIVKGLNASVFVNKIYDYYKSYYFNGYKVDRPSNTDPYFGMELTYNF